MSQKDKIHIRDLLIRGVIGVNDWEREIEQDILVNISLDCDLRPSAQTDELDENLNYRTLTKKIISHVEEAKRFTVEALANDICRICLMGKGVARARVCVEKPGALRFARSVGVEMERAKADFD